MGFNFRILYCQYIKIWSDFHRDNPFCEKTTIVLLKLTYFWLGPMYKLFKSHVN